jgi:hypothetical protein
MSLENTPEFEKMYEVPPHSFCETVTSGRTARWHIRPLTYKGKMLGGGADTLALCGRKVAWDLGVEITEGHLKHSCFACVEIYRRVR